MTDRHTADTITSDALDALYDRLSQARNAAVLHRQGLLSTAELYAAVEAGLNPGPAATQATERNCLFAHDGGRPCSATDRCATCDTKEQH